jgi:hypothetical protein
MNKTINKINNPIMRRSLYGIREFVELVDGNSIIKCLQGANWQGNIFTFKYMAKEKELKKRVKIQEKAAMKAKRRLNKNG